MKTNKLSNITIDWKKINWLNWKEIEIRFLILMTLLMKVMNVVKMEDVAYVKEFILWLF